RCGQLHIPCLPWRPSRLCESLSSSNRAGGLFVAGDDALEREIAGEGAAGAFSALDAERRTVPLQRVLDDREAQTRAAHRARTAWIDAIETFGEARDVLGRDADAGVAHGQMSALPVDPPAHFDLAFAWRVLHRVGHQIGDDRM